MKTCNNVNCSASINKIEWEDNLVLCPICNVRFLGLTDDNSLSEYYELKDICDEPVLSLLNFKVSKRECYDVEEVANIINVHQPESKDFESLIVKETVVKDIVNEPVVNDSIESNRIKLLSDFINKGKEIAPERTMDEIKLEETKVKIELPEINDINLRKDDAKIGKDEMIIGNFIVNKKILFITVVIFLIIIICVVLQVKL